MKSLLEPSLPLFLLDCELSFPKVWEPSWAKSSEIWSIGKCKIRNLVPNPTRKKRRLHKYCILRVINDYSGEYFNTIFRRSDREKFCIFCPFFGDFSPEQFLGPVRRKSCELHNGEGVFLSLSLYSRDFGGGAAYQPQAIKGMIPAELLGFNLASFAALLSAEKKGCYTCLSS